MNPDEYNKISEINMLSGKIIVTLRNKAAKLSGSLVRPKKKGFIVINRAHSRSNLTSVPSIEIQSCLACLAS